MDQYDKNNPDRRDVIGKQGTKNFKERLTSLFSFKKKDEQEDIPAPGTPPTFNADGSINNPGNPYIGRIDPRLGYAPVGYSGKELRRIKRAQQRREAAKQRVGQNEYNRLIRIKHRHEADNRQRDRIKSGEISVPAAVLENIERDEARIADLPQAQAWLDSREAKAQAREDRLADRREARFRAGKPRGKDLREDIYKEHESLLPDSVNRRRDYTRPQDHDASHIEPLHSIKNPRKS